MSNPLNYKRHDGYRFHWNGSKTVNIYNAKEREVDVFSLDYGRDDYTMREVVRMCDEWEIAMW